MVATHRRRAVQNRPTSNSLLRCRASTTDAGIGTRFELIRTTSFGSISSLELFAVERAPGRLGSTIVRGAGFGGVLPGSWCRPDWPWAVKAVQAHKPATMRRISARLNGPAPLLVWSDFARATLPILSRPLRLAIPGVHAFYALCAAPVREEEVKARK